MTPPSRILFLFLSLPSLASSLISCEEACASCDDEAIPSVLREVHCSMCQECEGKGDGQEAAEVVFPQGCPLPPLCQPMAYCPPLCPITSQRIEKLTRKTTTTTIELPKPRPTLAPATKQKLLVPVMPCCMPMCAAPCYPWPVAQQQQTTEKLTDTTPESAESTKDYDYVYVGVEKQKLRDLRRLNPS